VKRLTPEQARQWRQRSKPLKRQSDKQAAELRKYRVWRKEALARRPNCELRWSLDCLGKATEVNHIWKQSQGAPLIPRSESDWNATCRPCHERIDQYPQEAKDRGFIRRQTW